MSRSWPLVALAVFALACEPPTWQEGPYPADIVETEVQPADTAVKDVAPKDTAPVDTGPPAACPAHVLQCPAGQGCHEGTCGSCADASECRALEGCVAGHCGACKSASDCKSPKQCINGFCMRSPIRKWNLIVDPNKWKGILAKPSLKQYIPCSMKVDDVVYDQGCEVRIRGGVSKSYPKKSFRIRFPQDADHPGYSRKINLRSEYNDPTFMRNYLASWLFDQVTGIPTPRVRFRRLAVNGKDQGVYAEVERIGSRFRKKRGRDAGAPLYESDPPSSLAAKGAGGLIKLPGPSTYMETYQKHSDPEDDYTDLVGLIEKAIWPDYTSLAGAKLINGTVETAQYVDYLAVQGVIMNADHVRKNYYFSLQKTAGSARWEFYPWDMDMSFGCEWKGGEELNYCTELSDKAAWDAGALSDPIVEQYPTKEFFSALIDSVMRSTQLTGEIKARMCKILGSHAWKTRLPALMDALEDGIVDDVASDPMDMNKTAKGFRDEVDKLRKWVKKRTTVLGFNLDCGG